MTGRPWQWQWENARYVEVEVTTSFQLGNPRSQHRSAWRLVAGSCAALLILSAVTASLVLNAGSGGPSCALGSCRSRSYTLDASRSYTLDVALRLKDKKKLWKVVVVDTQNDRPGCWPDCSISENATESLSPELANQTLGPENATEELLGPRADTTTVRQIIRTIKPSHQRCSAMQTRKAKGMEAKVGLCRGVDEFFSAANLTTDVDFPVVDPSTTLLQLGRMREHLDGHNPWQRLRWEEAFEALQALSELQARDVFAFRETWTDFDTELLRGLDAGTNGFVPDDSFTTEAFAARLPSMDELKQVLHAGQSLAIVGGSDSLTGKGLGQEIDAHDQVVRFNEIVGSKLVPEETGNVTTVRVMNTLIPPLKDPAILEMDLETLSPWSSYCKRMHSSGMFTNNVSNTLMIRPSAYCAMAASRTQEWTRGFLFYWFVGRLVNASVDFYGFSGYGHYHNNASITETWVPFEHMFYKVNNLTCH